jgi:hypothetical protein
MCGRRCAASASKEVDRPGAMLDEWCGLYDVLVARHALTGMHAFSRAAFALQLSVPGIRVFRAVENGTTVAAQVWYVANRVAFMHLLASSERGYAIRASYGLVAEALQRLGAVADYADLGGSAGDGEDDGLFRFKAGWSAARIPVHLCGAVLRPTLYRGLSGDRASDYFPAYRQGEWRRPSRAGCCMTEARWREVWDAWPRACERGDHLRQVGKTVGGVPIPREQVSLMTGAIAERLDLKSSDVLLDLCCGNGLITSRLAECCRRVVGIDFSEPLLDIARTRPHAGNVVYQLGSVTDLDRLPARHEAFTISPHVRRLQHLSRQDSSSGLLRVLVAMTPASG